MSPLRSPKPDKKFEKRNWFEATGTFGLIRDAGSMTHTQIPYLCQSTRIVIRIIDIVQSLKDNKTSFRRLGQDAAILVVALLESYERSKDQERWPEDKADLLKTLKAIDEFTLSQVGRSRFLRVMKYVSDRYKIKKYREELEAAMNRFELSAHLQLYERLRASTDAMKTHKDNPRQPAAFQRVEVTPQIKALPPVPDWEDEEEIRLTLNGGVAPKIEDAGKQASEGTEIMEIMKDQYPKSEKLAEHSLRKNAQDERNRRNALIGSSGMNTSVQDIVNIIVKYGPDISSSVTNYGPVRQRTRNETYTDCGQYVGTSEGRPIFGETPTDGSMNRRPIRGRRGSDIPNPRHQAYSPAKRMRSNHVANNSQSRGGLTTHGSMQPPDLKAQLRTMSPAHTHVRKQAQKRKKTSVNEDEATRLEESGYEADAESFVTRDW